MLTKAECVFSLAQLYSAIDRDWKSDEICKDTIEQLINEHFENPPLKFEELKEEQWYWDNKNKRYFKIHKLDRDNKEIDAYDFWGLGFEENRFYRYEVKE